MKLYMPENECAVNAHLRYSISTPHSNYFAVISPEQANLPADILQTIPYMEMQNSSVGDPPEGFWEHLAGEIGQVFHTVVGIIYNGLVALANLIEKAADVVAQFFLKLWDVVVGAVKHAVEVIKKAVDALAKWFEGVIKNKMNPVIEKIKEEVKEWVDNLIELSDALITSYENDGNSEQMKSEVNLYFELLFGHVFLELLGLFVGLTILTVALGPVLGVIVSGIATIVTSIILLAFIGNESIEHEVIPLNIFEGLTLDNSVEMTRNYLESQGATDDGDSAIWEILSIAFGMMGAALTAGVYELLEAPVLSYFALGVSIAMTVMAVIVEGYINGHAQSYIERKEALRLLTFTEDVCMVLGLLVDVLALRNIWEAPQITPLLVLSLAFKGIGLIFSLGVLASLN